MIDPYATLPAEATTCENCGRSIAVVRFGRSAPALCGACAGNASPHPERSIESAPEVWSHWRP
jgi:hypothetical protein